MKLQRFGFKESRYERPNHAWECQWKRDGKACNAGPTPDGECIATFECFPQRSGDRWFCTRDAFGGGKCEQGPRPDGRCGRPLTPCIPVTSIRSRRGRVVRWLTALVIGLLLLVLTGPLRDSVISPGELAFAHSADENQCAACHSAAGSGLLGWLDAATHNHAESDSMLCLDCHPIGDEPLRPHGVPTNVLEAYENRSRDQAHGQHRQTLLAVANDGSQETLACVRCHHDHRGATAKLTEVSDQQCQACHGHSFGRFSQGHPEFGDYPFDRRTRIIFDHDSHRAKHYPDAEKSFECTFCHAPDPAGETMLISPFDTSCGGCHRAEIEGEGQSGEKGIAVISVPGLDLDTLEERERPIGEWPADAEAELSPLMRALLSADPVYRGSQQRLKDVDLLDLSSEDEDTLTAVGDMAWAVKRLIAELSFGGHQAYRERLETVVGGEVDVPALSALSGALPLDQVLLAKREWFPNLAVEIRQNDDDEPVPLKRVEMESAAETLSPEPADTLSDDLGALEEPLQEDDGTGEAMDIESSDEDEDVFAMLGDEESTDEPDPEEETEVADIDATSLAGGWYRHYYSLYYRPVLHADRFVYQWLQSTSVIDTEHSTAELGAVATVFADTKGPGRCSKCHSIDSADDGVGTKINWFPKRPGEGSRGFIRFSHSSHVNLMGTEGCLRCHPWSRGEEDKGEEGGFIAAYENRDPYILNGNFENISTQICSDCHRKGKVDEACITCHRYHIGDLSRVKSSGSHDADPGKF